MWRSVLVAMMLSAVAAARPYAPIVTMVVTMPDGRIQELTAAESGLATVTLKDGTKYGFRPTIQDSAPWNRIVVTIFRGATERASTTVLGEIEVRRGGPAMESKRVLPSKCPFPRCQVQRRRLILSRPPERWACIRDWRGYERRRMELDAVRFWKKQIHETGRRKSTQRS